MSYLTRKETLTIPSRHSKTVPISPYFYDLKYSPIVVKILATIPMSFASPTMVSFSLLISLTHANRGITTKETWTNTKTSNKKLVLANTSLIPVILPEPISAISTRIKENMLHVS